METCPICHKPFESLKGSAYEYDDELQTENKLVRYHSECLYSTGKLSRMEYETLYKRDENE